MHHCDFHTHATPRRWIVRGKLNPTDIDCPVMPCPKGTVILMDVKECTQSIRLHVCMCIYTSIYRISTINSNC